MTKELEALKRLRQETCPCTYNNDFDKEKCCDIIETALKDFEWLKSILSIDFFEKLPADDKLKLLEILGLEIEYE